MAKGTWVEINGGVARDDGKDLTDDEFLDAFIDFVESKGWHFGGGTITREHDYDPEEETK